MAERPGIMIYFDMAEPTKMLDYRNKGRLFEAMLNYGQYGEVPNFNDDGMLLMAWGFILPRLDADEKSYRKKVIKTTYSSYCSKVKQSGMTPATFEEWCKKEGVDTSEWCRMASTDIERYPTTTPNIITTTTPNTETSSTAKRKPKIATAIEADVDGGVKGEEDLSGVKDFEALRKKKMAKLKEVM